MENPSAEEAYELVLGSSKGVRSLIAEYSIKEEGKAFVQALNDTAYNTATEQKSAIKTLIGRGCADLEILGPKMEKPQGCAVFPVSASVAAYVYVKGRVDIDQEIEKAKGKLKKAQEVQQRQKKTIEDLSGKASVAVVESEMDKLRDCTAEVGALDSAIQQFESLKVEG